MLKMASICENSKKESELEIGLFQENSKSTAFAKNGVVMGEWMRLLRLMRIFGNCPVCLEMDSEAPIQFRLCSWSSAISIVLLFGKLVIAIFHLTTDWSVSIIGPGSEYQIQDWIIELTNRWSLPIQQVWELFCTWITLGKLILLFNNWSRFEKEFSIVFTETKGHTTVIYKTGLRPLRYALCASSLFLLVIANLVSSLYFQHGGLSVIKLDLNLISFAVRLTIMSTMFLEEIKVIMMYQTLSEGFRNVRRGIQSQMKDSVTTLEMVVQWKRCIEMLRQQVRLTGEVQSLHQLAALFHSVVLYTETLYMFIKGAVFTKGPSIHIAVMFGIMSFNHFIRFMAKTIMAERITAEEMRVAEVISAINPVKLELNTNLELTKLGYIMRQSPSKISLSGFVTIENRLVLKMSSYIVGYLVVLIQFHLTNRGRGD